jgi:hypothetical protein
VGLFKKDFRPPSLEEIALNSEQLTLSYPGEIELKLLLGLSIGVRLYFSLRDDLEGKVSFD